MKNFQFIEMKIFLSSQKINHTYIKVHSFGESEKMLKYSFSR